LIFAAYLLTGLAPQIVGRTLHRFRATKPFPSEALADQVALPSCAISLPSGAARWAALAIALEEDGGEDVQRLFGVVEHHQRLAVWTPDSDVEPLTINSLPLKDEWSLPREIGLLIDGHAASATCRSDKWIGAVCWLMPGNVTVSCSRFRLPFVAEDQRNDWTAIVEIER
jgi:hypothetical protein